MKLGLMIGSALVIVAAAALAAGAADPPKTVSGRIADVDSHDDGVTVVTLSIDGDEELSLIVGQHTAVSVDGESVPQTDLWDCIGADARVSYRNVAGVAILESVAVTWPEDEDLE